MTDTTQTTELRDEDLDAISGGPTAVEYAITRGPKGLEKATPRKGDEGGPLSASYIKFDG